MFTRHNLWFGLRGHRWSFENQPSLFSSLGKYLGWFLIMSLWSQKPKDFGVKNWYCILQVQKLLNVSIWKWLLSFELSKLFTDSLFAPLEDSNLLRLSWKLYYSVFHSTFFPPRKNGKGSQTSGGWDVLSCFHWTWTVFPCVPQALFGVLLNIMVIFMKLCQF